MVKDTKKYLIEKGYKEVDIMSIESKYDMKRNTDRIKGTVAYVVFKDEPKGEYLYIQWRDSGKIQQHCEYYSESAQAYEVTFTEKESTWKLFVLKNIKYSMKSNCLLTNKVRITAEIIKLKLLAYTVYCED